MHIANKKKQKEAKKPIKHKRVILVYTRSRSILNTTHGGVSSNIALIPYTAKYTLLFCFLFPYDVRV